MIDLYLQVSLDSDNTLFFYYRKGFRCYNDVTENPNTLYIPKELFVKEKHMILLYCEYGCYSAFCKPNVEDIECTEKQKMKKEKKKARL